MKRHYQIGRLVGPGGAATSDRSACSLTPFDLSLVSWWKLAADNSPKLAPNMLPSVHTNIMPMYLMFLLQLGFLSFLLLTGLDVY